MKSKRHTEDMWAAVGWQEMLQSKRQKSSPSQRHTKKSCDREWALLYGATDIKRSKWSGICIKLSVLLVAQIINHFPSGFSAWESDSGARMVCQMT